MEQRDRERISQACQKFEDETKEKEETAQRRMMKRRGMTHHGSSSSSSSSSPPFTPSATSTKEKNKTHDTKRRIALLCRSVHDDKYDQ